VITWLPEIMGRPGYASTAAKHGIAVFTAIRDPLAGNSGYRPSRKSPQTTPESNHTTQLTGTQAK
jgi:hypothetical protein